jgi:BirA family transcriptional regulator, biotin operon repressor / biotin---[acetyl-CoA-carboxylase] ligase
VPLPTNPIRWPLEAIWQAIEPQLQPQLPGFTCEVLPVVDSTNTELMRRFKAGQPEPTLLVAEQQSAGRGRLGRQWHSQRGDSLMFSLGMPLAPADWSGLSLAVGISLAESLDAANSPDHRIALKWPNDLWLVQEKTERKLGGILVETATFEGQRYVVIGVGINVRSVEFDAQNSTAIAPGCLQDLQPDADVASTLLRVLPPLVQTVQAFAQFGFAPFQARFNRRDVLTGRDVKFSDGMNGQAHGVTELGALLVHTSAGMKEITSSEVTVRPVSGGAPAEDLRPC